MVFHIRGIFSVVYFSGLNHLCVTLFFNKMEIVVFVELDIVIHDPAEIFSGQITDDTADRDPGGANDFSKLRMSTADFQLEPVSINDGGRICNGAEKSFQSILRRKESQVFDFRSI